MGKRRSTARQIVAADAPVTVAVLLVAGIITFVGVLESLARQPVES